jgi:hypothetical protein
MLPNTGASPFCNFPCLHTVESKNSEQAIDKTTCFIRNPKLLFVHIQKSKAKNLLHYLFNDFELCPNEFVKHKSTMFFPISLKIWM